MFGAGFRHDPDRLRRTYHDQISEQLAQVVVVATLELVLDEDPGARLLALDPQGLGPEFVIKVKGKVGLRPKGMENPKIPTGEVEIAAEELEILNSSAVPVFEIDDTIEASEELKLTYRYLDLRRNRTRRAITLPN